MGLIGFISAIFYLFIFVILFRCCVGMILGDEVCKRRKNIFYAFIYDFSEPILKPFRKMLPNNSQFDISPILAILSLELALSSIIDVYSIIFGKGY